MCESVEIVAIKAVLDGAHLFNNCGNEMEEKGVLLEMIDKLKVCQVLTHFQSTSHFNVDKA